MGLKPPCVLIDCSELELGRNLGTRTGRIDDSIDAYKRRLELYRELTLPMLKTFDEQNRLKIVSLPLFCQHDKMAFALTVLEISFNRSPAKNKGLKLMHFQGWRWLWQQPSFEGASSLHPQRGGGSQAREGSWINWWERNRLVTCKINSLYSFTLLRTTNVALKGRTVIFLF